MATPKPADDLRSMASTTGAIGSGEATRYAPDSVGAHMDPHFLTFRENSKVSEAVDMIRFLSNHRMPLLYAYVVDDDYKLKGVLVMRDLLVSPDETRLGDIMRPDPYSINVNRKRDEVAREAVAQRYLAVPIVDDEHHLLGALKFGDIIGFAEEESSKNVQKIFGAGAEETATSTIKMKIGTRLPWLQVNLATSFLASAVIGAFEETIARITALAIFLPIIAGQGGNTGAQSLAVVIRGLSLDQIPSGWAWRIIWRESAAGIVNGIGVGLVTGLVAWLWMGNPLLGGIVGFAMILNMAMSTFFGAAIPLVMKRLGMDPAQCSNIILTTFTDVFGFAILLALAFIFQNRLV